MVTNLLTIHAVQSSYSLSPLCLSTTSYNINEQHKLYLITLVTKIILSTVYFTSVAICYHNIRRLYFHHMHYYNNFCEKFTRVFHIETSQTLSLFFLSETKLTGINLVN